MEGTRTFLVWLFRVVVQPLQGEWESSEQDLVVTVRVVIFIVVNWGETEENGDVKLIAEATFFASSDCQIYCGAFYNGKSKHFPQGQNSTISVALL